MAQPCALLVSLNLLLLITSFIGSNKSIINDVLSSIKDSPQNGSYMSPWLLHQHKQTDNQSMVSVTKDLTSRFATLRGIAAHHKQHIRPHGNFMYSGVFPLEPDTWNEYVVSILCHFRISVDFRHMCRKMIFSTCCERWFSSGEDTRAKRIHLWWLSLNPFPLSDVFNGGVTFRYPLVCFCPFVDIWCLFLCVYPLNALYAVLRPFAVSRYVIISKTRKDSLNGSQTR